MDIPEIPKSVCSPRAGKKQGGKSCLSYELLVLIATLYNQQHTDKIVIENKRNKTKLWNALKSKLSTKCGDNEACWIEQPFVKRSPLKEKIDKNFKPKKPEAWNDNPREWLNTYDILDVMKQYEEADKTFYFVGVFPADFANKNSGTSTCVVKEMCQLNLEDCWKRGIRKIGVIFNTDTSKGPGQHWLGCHIGLDPRRKNFGVYFYDSVAMKPQKEFQVFMQTMKKELEKLHPKYKQKIEFRVNTVRRQYKGWNCGIFSILFQIMMLTQKFKNVCENMGYDDDVQEFREILYRT